MKLIQAAGCSPVKVWFGVCRHALNQTIETQKLSPSLIVQGVVWSGFHYQKNGWVGFHSLDSLNNNINYQGGTNYVGFGAHVPYLIVEEVFETEKQAKDFVKSILSKKFDKVLLQASEIKNIIKQL
jgi:hypothetical protein